MMIPPIYTTADLHLRNDDSYGIYDADGVNDFLLLRYEAMAHLISDAQVHAGHLISAGDLLDGKRAEAQTMYYGSKIMDMADRLRLAIFLRGNHDTDTNSGSMSLIAHWKHLVGNNVRIVTYPRIEEKDGIEYHCIPASESFTEDFPKAIKELKNSTKKSKTKVLVSHGPIRGAKLDNNIEGKTGIDKSLIGKLSKWYDWIIFGDYHRYQMLCHNGWYCGSVIQSSLKDKGSDKFYQVIANGEMKLMPFKMSPRFLDGEFDVSSGEKFSFKRCGINKEDVPGSVMVIKLIGRREELDDFDRSVIREKADKFGAKRLFVNTTTEKDGVRVGVISIELGPETWVQKWVDMNKEELPADREKVTARGLAYMR